MTKIESRSYKQGRPQFTMATDRSTPGKPDAGDLRRRAEEGLQQQMHVPVSERSEVEVRKLVHELQVHQVELELQNEALSTAQAKLEAALARSTELYDAAPVGYFTLNRTGDIVLANLAGARLLDTERDCLTGVRFAALLQDDSREALTTLLQRVFESGAPQSCEVILAFTPRRIIQMEATLSADGNECRAAVLDITARRDAEAALRENEARLQLAARVFSHVREGIFIADARGTIIEVNDTFTHITGFTRDESIGQSAFFRDTERQAQELQGAIWRALHESGTWCGERWSRRKDGDVCPETLTISAVRDASGQVTNYVALFSDISSQKAHQQQLEHVAHYDPLTNLPNRVLLADRLHHAMAQTQRRDKALAVAYLDLDGFKLVNDTYGHNVGDDLLVAVTEHMKEALREGDTLARMGGDEFVAVLVDLESAEDCKPVLERLLQAAASPVIAAGVALQVSASIGATIFPSDRCDADHLIRHADQSMYFAKQTGKNRYHIYDVEFEAAVRSLHENIEDIRLGFEREQFVLHYQPKVDMCSGKVVGAEALIRWQHPTRGLLLPAAFLHVIENHPFSIELGEWVIQTALVQLRNWRAAGLDLPVSVNIAALHLQQSNFAARLAHVLSGHKDLCPGRLEIEILENCALDDMVQVSESMHACRALGVTFSLDDFGMGYSSLTYLKRLPADLLKIDKSFVREMVNDPDDLSIVSGVIGLAKAFRRQVLAEGVETIAQGTMLLSLGCSLAQGYCIARPMPASEFTYWVARWQPDEAWAARVPADAGSR
ncbi:putative bifunctional diguanylate cyclase/phosphodiesterase [Parazoarcus communis]|uniref:putative bifunctional diguanylate cyclase/phosphodiesterase n=1 Tax=Parazoarcus communis TaxID=41977 RepID=UPI001F38EF93|nr:EAL domain-containing protein [Parazoarcus communis]